PVCAGPTEATALGNVLVQAMAAGDVGSLSEIREIVRRSETIAEFAPQNTAEWDAQWERFQSLN
ncbi:MAG: rhamnulokinase, partial [Planctomycetaceae bacterium]